MHIMKTLNLIDFYNVTHMRHRHFSSSVNKMAG